MLAKLFSHTLCDVLNKFLLLVLQHVALTFIRHIEIPTHLEMSLVRTPHQSGHLHNQDTWVIRHSTLDR
jgi:hypothetical protein